MSRCATRKIQVSSSKVMVTLQISSNINPLYGFCEFDSPTTQKSHMSNTRVYAHASIRKPGVHWLVVFINRLLIASDIVAQVDIRVQR
ncbi:hypothetical protein DPMN_066594 [Dreissena polymorpha]|uniref:Uncharacterized protein n=1 Tax=Dreissena polymorpha TaxID=45954 RepID=A0A9D3YVS5_DREPO|nr:hypothetical protein DPMN_066594 [Dreissena polymorpha]